MAVLRRSLLTALLATLPMSAPAFAQAECTELYFSVNDYGKEIPKRDAQEMLDKFAAEWAEKKGIKTYKMGEKTVECELFIDLIVFDEYTCKATAEICWRS